MSETALPFHKDTSLTNSENSASMIVKVGHPFVCATTSHGVKPHATALANHEPTSRCSNRLINESQSVESILSKKRLAMRRVPLS